MASIRLAADTDAAAIAGMYRPIVESTIISFETEAPDESEMRRRIGDTLPAHPWLVYDANGIVAGYAYASKHRVRAAYQWSVDASVYIHQDYRRMGIGRGLYASLFAILTAQGFFNAYAGITLPNPGSVALHEAAGFQPIGVYRYVGYKLGAWHDVGWWGLALRQHSATPDAPLSIAALQEREEWPALLSTGTPLIRMRVA
jgi:L-amino acid N-acyltransferase YncA